jgi:protein-disulfide isomerase
MATEQKKLTRDQQREAARTKARELRERHKASESRKRLIIQVSVVVAVLAIVAVIVLAFTTSPSTKDGAVPKVAAVFSEGGVKVGKDLKAFTSTSTPTATPTAGATPQAVPNIKVYIDYQCPFCENFEKANAAQIKEWVTSGSATFEVHPISFLDSASANHYSSRAANAAICVAENSPDSFYEYNATLFANQPAEGSAGPENGQLFDFAKALNVNNESDIKKCIDGNLYQKWIADTTTGLLGQTIPETDYKLEGTPFVMVNNQQYTYQTIEERNDPARFAQFVQTVSSTTSSK